MLLNKQHTVGQGGRWGWVDALLWMLSACTGGFLAAPPQHPALALPHPAAPGAGQTPGCCLGFHKPFFFFLLLVCERGRRL